jgi:hypothetical protein
VIQQGGLASAEEAGEKRDGNRDCLLTHRPAHA